MQPRSVAGARVGIPKDWRNRFRHALVFFGFHCVFVGYLLFKSTFFPRILGILLAIGGVGYLANIFLLL